MRARKSGSTYRAKSSKERGIVLLVSILALLLLTLLGLALTTMGIVATNISTNAWENSEAFYIADSGITHAKALIFDSATDPDVFLQAGNGIACDGDELSGVAVGPITSIAAGGHPFPPGGRYEVQVCDDDESNLNPPDFDPNTDINGRFRVLSTGFGRNGSVAALELIVGSNAAPAILVEGNLRINGNPKIQGQNGAAQANGQLELNGNPKAEQAFNAGGAATISGGPKTGPPPDYDDDPADINSGEEAVEAPDLEPQDLRPSADSILGSDGLIRDQSGAVIGNATGGPWKRWSWDPGGQRWVAGNNIPQGTYYAEGNIDVSGNPGISSPLPLTLIAEGWIDISGNPDIIPSLTQGSVSYTLVAGTDLSISGSPNFPSPGLYFAGDQLKILGNPTMNGRVIAADSDDQPFPNPGGINLVVLSGGFMEISGSPIITFDDDSDGLIIPTVASWRECRGADPTNPCQ